MVRKRKILSMVIMVIATMLMASLPHHHHHEHICFERVEKTHAESDNRSHSDDSHPETCISSISYLPQHLLKSQVCVFLLQLFDFCPYKYITECNILESTICFNTNSKVLSFDGYFYQDVWRAPPMLL